MKKIMRILTCGTLLLGTLMTQAFAASGNVGYAIYRDGVDVVIVHEWHAAIVTNASKSSSKYVVHASLGEDVGYGGWDDFLYGVGNDSSDNDNQPQGVYKPRGGITSSERDDVAKTARELTSERISYTFAGMMGHTFEDSYRTIEPDEIASMRCDGVVEYCFEYNGHKIIGGSSDWDISINAQPNYDAHNNNGVWPSTQADAMKFVADL